MIESQIKDFRKPQPDTVNNSEEKYSSEDLDDAKTRRYYADTALRERYSFKVYKIVKKSLWGWAILLAIYGLIKFLTRNENNGHGFEIFSDNTLIAITSATTLNIFAAFLSLVKGLFPSLKDEKKE